MLIKNVRQGMILQVVDSGHNQVVQTLEDVRFTAANGVPDSYCEFYCVDLVTGNRFTIGEANPSCGWAPGLTLVGWACGFA